MRILAVAAALIAVFYFLKYDFNYGTISLAAFYNTESEACIEQEVVVKMNYISIQTVANDTIYSLFSLYPDDKKSFIERLSDFYKLNPHLINQPFAGSETVKIPIYEYEYGRCK